MGEPGRTISRLRCSCSLGKAFCSNKHARGQPRRSGRALSVPALGKESKGLSGFGITARAGASAALLNNKGRVGPAGLGSGSKATGGGEWHSSPPLPTRSYRELTDILAGPRLLEHTADRHPCGMRHRGLRGQVA